MGSPDQILPISSANPVFLSYNLEHPTPVKLAVADRGGRRKGNTYTVLAPYFVSHAIPYVLL